MPEDDDIVVAGLSIFRTEAGPRGTDSEQGEEIRGDGLDDDSSGRHSGELLRTSTM